MNQILIKNRNGESALSYFGMIIIVLFGWFASGCGASQSGDASTYYSSAFPSSLAGSSSGNANCNQTSSSVIRFNASLRTVDGTPSMMRVRITELTSQFDGNSNENIQFFRWKVVGGVSTLDSTPLTFHLEYASHNGQSGNELSGNMTGLNMSNVNQIVSSNFLGTTTAEQFFNQVDIIVHGVSTDYQVLKMVIYNNGSIVASNDVLLPPFAANPLTYDTTHVAVLNGLHPFAAQLGYSDAQYASMAQSFCF